VSFDSVIVADDAMIGNTGWYLNRPGFWHGACGPAACWAGGAAGLVDWASRQRRDDPHTLAHLGAMQAQAWGLGSILDSAGREIDAAASDASAGRVRALSLRHLVEQACTDIMRRLVRAYGPYPIAMDAAIVQRYSELDVYLRQSHAERDLEVLGRMARQAKL
jgi:alkylation response protein AidB-like acyl-CoA dehydrogenase